jgi:hypothetical protein
MMNLGKGLLIAAVTMGLLSPAAALPEPATEKHPTKIRVHPKRGWHGYGFLPGYHPQPALSEWRERAGPQRQPEWRYRRVGWGWYGPLQYGYGNPGFYRGQWNGGSFGPCWTQTPIGPQWNCGK